MSMLWINSPITHSFYLTGLHNQRLKSCRPSAGLGDTDNTTMYHDTKSSRYWCRLCLDTI